MIADNLLPEDALFDCTDADRSEISAVLARISSSGRLGTLSFVSLDLPDAEDRIAARIAQGRTVLALATIARKTQRKRALDQGVHEFLTTGPVDQDQLSARLDLLGGRPALPPDLSFYPENGRLSLSGEVHGLNERESALVEALFEKKGGFATHEELLEKAWGSRTTDRQNLRVAINRLRKRIEPEPGLPRYFLSEPAIGYRLGRPASHRHM